MIQGRKIWDVTSIPDRETSRMELTDLIRFRGHCYCGFREAEIHQNHPSGRARVLRSADGESWETAALFDWDAADVRAPRLCVTSEGELMAYTSVYFCSRQAREGGAFYQLDDAGTPESDREADVARQSVAWLSPDGVNWSSAYACPTGANTFRWGARWHNGMGYAVAYGGKDPKGALYRTRDGKSWRLLLDTFAPHGRGGEGSLAFGADDTGYCLFRDGARGVALGVGKAPYYTDWEWRDLSVDWGDGPKPAEEVFRAPFGGPKIMRLRDGRLLGAARVLGPGRDNGRITLFRVDPERSVLTYLEEFGGTTYGGIEEHGGRIWVSYAARDVSAVYLASIELPS